MLPKKISALLAAILFLFIGYSLWRGSRPAKLTWLEPGLSMEETLRRFSVEGDVPVFGPTLAQARIMVAEAETTGDPAKARKLMASGGKALLRRGALAEAVEVLGRLVDGLEELARSKGMKPPTQPRAMLLSAQLRNGEEANCMGNHNADSCLLPISGGGIHLDRSPFEAAQATIREDLVRDPDNLLSRWLLNVVCMALDEWPEAVEERWLLPPDLFASDMDFPRFRDVGPGVGVSPNGMSGGAILDDFDGDGLVDVIASSMGLEDSLRFYRNNGDGTFSDRTESAGLSGQLGGLTCNQADYDNDGDLDILVLRGGWMGNGGPVPNSLLRNRGDGTFEDVTHEAGLFTYHGTQAASWSDYDLDGFLDLFVGNESTKVTLFAHPSELWHNRGDGTFENVIRGSGIDHHAFAKGVAWGDIDEDGDPDLFVARRDGPSRLYRNETPRNGGADPKFVDITEAAGIDVVRRDFPAWFFDFDQDGRLDIFVGGYSSVFRGDDEDPLSVIPQARMGMEIDPASYPALWHNQGDGTFKNVAEEMGLGSVALVMGANYGDLDNDGWPDLYLGTGHPDFRALMANRVFRNDGGKAFQDVTTAAGMGHLQKGHGIAFGDIDNDGDQDVYAVLGGWYPADVFPNALFENPGFTNHWITLHLEGTTANRQGVGARITIDVETPSGPRAIHHLVGSGGSFGASTLAAEIGLGSATSLTRCVIRWPGGEQEEFDGLALDAAYRVVEGGQPERIDRQAIQLAGKHGEGHPR